MYVGMSYVNKRTIERIKRTNEFINLNPFVLLCKQLGGELWDVWNGWNVNMR